MSVLIERISLYQCIVYRENQTQTSSHLPPSPHLPPPAPPFSPTRIYSLQQPTASVTIITNDGRHIVVRLMRNNGEGEYHHHPYLSIHPNKHSITLLITQTTNCQGLLRGHDQYSNLVVEQCQERVYHTDAGVDVIELGVFIVRGDNV